MAKENALTRGPSYQDLPSTALHRQILTDELLSSFPFESIRRKAAKENCKVVLIDLAGLVYGLAEVRIQNCGFSTKKVNYTMNRVLY